MKQRRAQLSIDLDFAFPQEAYAYGERTSGETHGVVLTKPHVVELILDLAGYVPKNDLAGKVLVEPSCGEGAFLTPAIKRLCESRRRHGHPWEVLSGAIRAYDIDPEHVELSRASVMEALLEASAPSHVAEFLAERWVVLADFLLTAPEQIADYVVGNPPYIRIENLAPELQATYRRRFDSLYDRADLYVAFIEHGLAQLSASGTLSYICADRWTLNRYGQRLREHISAGFKVNIYVDLHHASPFESDVIAYPAIFALGRGTTTTVRVARLKRASVEECTRLGKALASRNTSADIDTYTDWFSGAEPWVLTSPTHLQSLRDLEDGFPVLEDTGGTKVGIGVATGNDKVFIVEADEDIEPDRLVPLVMRGDIENGEINSSGRFVINTFRDHGGVIDVSAYPRLARYFESNSDAIRKRHVSQKNPSSWFRTIDRVYPDLVGKPKLLIPDIAGSMQVCYDEGRFHPHHNLYYIVSDAWDLEVLGGLISSKVALFFIWSYAVRMRGGYLRFQAQYLRRIRVPEPASLARDIQGDLRNAFRERDFSRLDSIALKAYGIPELPDFDFVDTRS